MDNNFTPEMDNYILSRNRAQKYFLNFDQEKLIREMDLPYDENYLYVNFVTFPYRINRLTGVVEKSIDQFQTVREANYNEVLSIFDLLCHDGKNKTLSGVWAGVNNLKGRPNTIGVGTDFHAEISRVFDADIPAFKKACEALGGIAVPFGDIGYKIPIFRDFSIIIKFYYSDDEFPAQTTVLWDEHTLEFVYYETAFYIAGFVLHEIAGLM